MHSTLIKRGLNRTPVYKRNAGRACVECRTRNCKTENRIISQKKTKKNEKQRTVNQRVTERHDHLRIIKCNFVDCTTCRFCAVQISRRKKREGTNGNQHDEDLQDTPEQMSKICDIQNSHRWNNQNKNKRAANFST